MPEKLTDKIKRKLRKSRNKLDKEAEMPQIDFYESKDIGKWFKQESKKRGISEVELANDVLRDGFFVEFEESTEATKGSPTGQVKLSFLGNPFSFGKKEEGVPEAGKETSGEVDKYRDLAENFAPVHAGIEWHRAFTAGGGMTIRSNDPRDKHKKEMVNYIKELCKNVYQDVYTIGLDKIVDMMLDPAFVDGCMGAEIVYDTMKKNTETGKMEYGIKFKDFVTEELQLKGKDDKMKKVYVTRKPSVKEWKSFKGIARLKMIDNAVNRCIPYRHPKSFEVLYWTIDEKSTIAQDGADDSNVKKLLPFQIFWLAPNAKGKSLKGNSLIRPVVTVAELVKKIQIAVGKGFERWANRKYFFVCGTEKRPWSPVHIRNFLKVLGMMISNNWAGVPVPQGFDVKEIGGRVFEGRDLLDHLISMICAGMKYPRDFLEYGRTRAGDTAWLAWQVEYGRIQLQIRRAIEHQLFKRHIWCKFGKTYRVPKQGTPKDKREKKSTYVPKIEWRSEGKWHKEKKIETLTKVLNVANPVGPELKLAIEKDLAETLGYGEVEFPSFEELRRQLRAMDKQLKEDLKSKKELTPKEKLEKRLDKGVSTTKKETDEDKRGISKSLGSTRNPKLVKKGMPSKSRGEFQEAVSIEEATRRGKYSRTKCMECDKPPTVEVLWAEGMAHAWFCDKHFKEWKKKPDKMSDTGTYEGDIVKKRKIYGEASKRWKDGPPKKPSKKFQESSKIEPISRVEITHKYETPKPVVIKTEPIKVNVGVTTKTSEADEGLIHEKKKTEIEKQKTEQIKRESAKAIKETVKTVKKQLEESKEKAKDV